MDVFFRQRNGSLQLAAFEMNRVAAAAVDGGGAGDSDAFNSHVIDAAVHCQSLHAGGAVERSRINGRIRFDAQCACAGVIAYRGGVDVVFINAAAAATAAAAARGRTAAADSWFLLIFGFVCSTRSSMDTASARVKALSAWKVPSW